MPGRCSGCAALEPRALRQARLLLTDLLNMASAQRANLLDLLANFSDTNLQGIKLTTLRIDTRINILVGNLCVIMKLLR